MSRSPWFWASVGALAGSVVTVLTLLAELGVRRPMGLLALHFDSAAIWVVESFPLLFGLTMLFLGRQATRFVAVPRGPSVSVNSMQPPPPIPEGITLSANPQIELADGVRTRTMVEEAASGPVDARNKALGELVKVLKEQTERAASESRAKSMYLANMSHELRNPLSAIVGYAELLQEEAEERRSEQAGDLRKVAQAGRQLVNLVNNLLDLSKIEVGQLAVVLQDVDLAQVVDEVRVEVAAMGVPHGVNFSTRVAPGARLVRGDHGRVRQILTHLLSHAFQQTKQGQVSLTIDRATPKRDAWIALKVKDTGQGMTAEERARAFDQYAEFAVRVNQGASLPGLELALARQLAELMGGRIELESDKGLGSTFTVILPPGKASEDTIGPRSAVALNERLAGLRILVVDAEAFGLSLLKYLERARLDVKLVIDLASARIAIQAEKPHIVIVDCGFEGVWELIEDLVVDGSQVVATSLRDEDVEPSLQLGVTAFLLRPIERRMVLATLERCVAGRKVA